MKNLICLMVLAGALVATASACTINGGLRGYIGPRPYYSNRPAGFQPGATKQTKIVPGPNGTERVIFYYGKGKGAYCHGEGMFDNGHGELAWGSGHCHRTPPNHTHKQGTKRCHGQYCADEYCIDGRWWVRHILSGPLEDTGQLCGRHKRE